MSKACNDEMTRLRGILADIALARVTSTATIRGQYANEQEYNRDLAFAIANDSMAVVDMIDTKRAELEAKVAALQEAVRWADRIIRKWGDSEYPDNYAWLKVPVVSEALKEEGK